MSSVFRPIILGVVILILGILNCKGNISSIHWYHRKRVSEENKKTFGKLIGLGFIIIGISFVVFGGFVFLTEKTQNPIFILIGAVILVAAIIVGLAMNFYAMIKYNKGIF